jgi:dCTP deaminase
MILKADEIAKIMSDSIVEKAERLLIRPQPDLKILAKSGAASVDLRLGTWFMTLYRRRMPLLEVDPKKTAAWNDAKFTRTNFVPFGGEYILHPGTFVLAATLEWIRMPMNLAAYVIGRSSWGRRGLIIATAAGVHPGYTGCLTLELTNVGEIPIAIKPGFPICQLFLHTIKGKIRFVDRSRYIGHRRPTLGRIEPDKIAKKLGKASHE